jgi:hypothetical protein
MDQEVNLPGIPTEYLPQGWRIKGAEKFSCSISLIENIVYGRAKNTAKNIEKYDYMLSLAEAEKQARSKKESDIANRITSLQTEL